MERFCIDYRAINRVSKLDSFPMLLVVETLDALSGTQYFSTLDLKSGYWQIEMDPSSRGKTSFVTHNGLYEFLAMPFGLTNSGDKSQKPSIVNSRARARCLITVWLSHVKVLFLFPVPVREKE